MQTVLQFGAGVFLRGFVDWIFQIMNEEGIVHSEVIVIKPTSRGNYTLLSEQKGCYHIWFAGLKNGKIIEEIKKIDCIKSVINPYENIKTFFNTAKVDSVRLVVSNTTEAGIYFNPAEEWDRISDSFAGKLTQWLYHRFEHFQGDPKKRITVLPCELVEDNGGILKEMVISYTEHWNLGKQFANWNENNRFCSTLVDRIVPGDLSKRERDEIRMRKGIEDPLLIKAEPYHLWAIESPSGITDIFPNIPDTLNIHITPDILSFREKKLRILNGSHTALVPVAYLLGARTVFEATEDALLMKYLNQVIYNEIIPVIYLDHSELEDYAQRVLERFRNPFIHHRLIDIASSSLAKFKIRLLPLWHRYYDKQREFPPLITFSIAALILFYRGIWAGAPIPLNDDPNKIRILQDGWNQDMRAMLPGILKELWSIDEETNEGITGWLIEKISVLKSDARKALEMTLN